MSAGELNCPEGCFSETSLSAALSLEIFSLSAIISICFSIKGVKTNPGQIVFTVIPFLAFSKAIALLNPTIPCFDATYADLFTEATKPCTDAILMILPQPAFCINDKEYLVRQKAALRLRAITCSHLAQGKLTHSSMCCIPALLTRTSTLPNFLIVQSTIFLQSAGFVKSAKIQKGVVLGYLVWNQLTVFLISQSEANPLRMTLQPLAASE